LTDTTPSTTRERSDEELLAHAEHLGTTHGTLDGHHFEIDDRTHADNLLRMFDHLAVCVDFRDQLRTRLGAQYPQHDGGADAAYATMLYPPLGITVDHPQAGDSCRHYERGYNEAICQVIRHRAALMVDPPRASAPHGYHKIRVVLTATSNPFLAPRLPLAGELEVYETSITHHVMPNAAVFREARPGGALGGPASVTDIAYVYDQRSVVAPTSFDIDRETVLSNARYYAWGRDDESGQPAHLRNTEEFVGIYISTWQALREGTIAGERDRLRLSTAYENWRRDGTLFGIEECSRCGRWLTDTDRAALPDIAAQDARRRRCSDCASH
jgi:hypothetical protein